MDETGLTVRIAEWSDDDLALICGIANAGGGTLLVESDQRTASFGFRKMRRIFESIPALVQRSLGIACYTEPIMENSQMWLHVTIPPAEYPLSYDGTFYLYADGENAKIDGAVLEKLMQEEEGANWEKRTSLKASASKALYEATAVFKDAVARDGDFEDDGDSLSFLSSIGLKDARSNLLTNAGILLLAEHPESMIPGAYIRIAKMDAKTNRPEASSEITGPLLTQLDDGIDTLMRDYIAPMAYEGSQGAKTAPPREALHEALLNALVHKDYESAIPIQISVYPTTITIFNMGRPPVSWTAESLAKPHPSRPNHPMLAEALRKVGMFHGWGSGSISMVSACSDDGVPSPSWELGDDDTTVIFPLNAAEATPQASSDAAQQAQESALASDASEANEQGSAGSESAKASTKLGRHARTPVNADAKRNTFAERSIAALLELELTGTDEYILKVLQTNGRVTATRIAGVLEVSESTVRRSFRRLKEHGLIERIGSDKAGYWKVNL